MNQNVNLFCTLCIVAVRHNPGQSHNCLICSAKMVQLLSRSNNLWSPQNSSRPLFQVYPLLPYYIPRKGLALYKLLATLAKSLLR